MSTVFQFTNLLVGHASDTRYYKSSDTSIPCPCRTPEGYRNAELHLAFGKYGPVSMAIGNGNIPAGLNVSYAFIAVSAGGVPISPSKTMATATPSHDFQVQFTMAPVAGTSGLYGGHWEIYRQEGTGPYLLLNNTLSLDAIQYTDNTAAGNTGKPYKAPVLCNEAGMIPQAPVDVIVKAFVQPIQSTRATRLSTEYLQEVFGNIEADDHLGIFPVTWNGVFLKFDDWSQSGDDFIEYDGKRFFVINSNMIPDPGDGNPHHHYEVGMRMIRSDGLTV